MSHPLLRRLWLATWRHLLLVAAISIGGVWLRGIHEPSWADPGLAALVTIVAAGAGLALHIWIDPTRERRR